MSDSFRPACRTIQNAAAVALVVLAFAGCGGGKESGTASVAELNAVLERELDLASKDVFYLVLDLGTSELVLKRKGAVLQTYPVLVAEMGTSKRGFVRRDPPDDWKTSIWTTGRLVPPLPSQKPIEDDSTAVPPLPEEAYPAPEAWQVEFQEGLILEVLAQDASRGGGIFSGLGTLFKTPTFRVRLTMEPKLAGSLYRGIPPEVSFLVRPKYQVQKETSDNASTADDTG